MHVLFREQHGLDEVLTPIDLGQTPADIAVLSFSDSDLGAFAAGWRAWEGAPTLRLANLALLRHPMSADAYIERTLSGAQAILIRVIGGESYWSYGLAQVHDFSRKHGIKLAVLPGDGRPDPRLDALSTLPTETLRRLSSLCQASGPDAARAALMMIARAADLRQAPEITVAASPSFGWRDPDRGLIAPPAPKNPFGVVVFYRSYLAADDCAPIDQIVKSLREKGFFAQSLFVSSLKDLASARWVRAELARLQPAIVVNATAFAARNENGDSPLDAAGCPVLQVALSTARRADWAASDRGLSPSDLAMHVVLPEVDGRLFAGIASFKAPAPLDPDLQFSCAKHEADLERIEAVCARAAAWRNLAQKPAPQRAIALVLSTYPGKAHQLAHAVGLDALASCAQILADMAGVGYAVESAAIAGGFGAALTRATLSWPLENYKNALQSLPRALQESLYASWGAPERDDQVQDGAFCFKAIRRGAALIALQPERGDFSTREADYHDMTRVPRHAFVAFYLWLRAEKYDALVHVGAHGALEWLPGKAAALSSLCWPEALIGALPVIYPFIVNDPGEAAQAKRRIGALTLGHMPPPLIAAGVPEKLARLENLLDEYSAAEGLDSQRRDRLISAIRAQAQSDGVEQDLGLSPDASPFEAMTRIDRFVCEIKDSQFGEGLHIFGQGLCGAQERAGLLDALGGRRVAPGPSGSPYRGRADVLPTGRNLYSVDPRAIPTRQAHAQGVKLAEEVLRRHLQDQGDWPKNLVIDLWGSATMRTGGEEFAMALHLAGLAPVWDQASDRVTGFEIVPLALLDRPRIDVALRVSGLFRDTFPTLAQMFEAGCAALAARRAATDEPPEDNPFQPGVSRVFGPRPGDYGVGLGAALEDYSAEGLAEAGEAWLRASAWSIDAQGATRLNRADLEERMRAADGFVHPQDLLESDLLMSADYAAHEGGFAAAAKALGNEGVALYHLDSARPDAPRARVLSEEVARVCRARAANPAWIAGMMKHGFRGAAEIAATLDHLAAFAHLTRNVPTHLFDLYYDATLARPEIADFLARENAGALAAMIARFQALRAAGLWTTRRNSIAASLDARLEEKNLEAKF